MEMTARVFISIAFLVVSASFRAIASDDDTGGFRDPFWPIGYEPRKDEPPPPPPKVVERTPSADVKPAEPAALPVAQPDWPAALRCLKISGYAESNGARSCVINGKTVSEGEKIAIAYSGFRYTWRVDRIAAQKSQMRFTRITVATLPKN